MKIAYFDCFSGCSGDMILGAFIDAGLELKTLKEGLSSLDIGDYKLTAEKVTRSSINATKFNVVINEHTHHHHRPLKDILKIIKSSRLPKNIKEPAAAMFQKLGQAEAAIHGVKISEVEFHELGAVDTIIDIVGTLIALDSFKIERVYASAIPTGSGSVRSAHGVLPVPAPATLKILTEANAPLITGPDKTDSPSGELITPTGAVLVTSLAKFDRPDFTAEKIGCGAGNKDFPGWPNIMRIWLGETSEITDDEMVLLETNIDDMNPQVFGYLIDKLLAEKAADVWFTPIYMKKNRPAVMLSVLAAPLLENKLIQIIMRETTTLGVRSRKVPRHTAQREIIDFKSTLGKVHLKLKRFNDNIIQCSPEYEDCREIAMNNNLPLLEVMRIVQAEAGRKFLS